MTRNANDLQNGYLNSRIPQASDSFETVMRDTQTRHMDFQNSDKMTWRTFNWGKSAANDFRLHDDLAG